MSIRFERSVHMAARSADDGAIEMAISSEAPYERWFGIEILRHSSESVDLTRLADGRHPLLLGHDTEKQIGVIDRAWLDGNKLRGAVRFSRSDLGQEIKQDVQDQIRTLVSVGYFIEEIEEIEKAADGTETVKRRMSGEEFEREMRAQHGESWNRAGPSAARGQENQPPTFIVTRWQPFEASVVPIPADVSVGIGRSAGVETVAAAPAAPAPATPAATPSPLIIVEKTMSEVKQKTPADLEIERRDGIQSLAEQYSKYLDASAGPNAVRNGHSVEQFKDFIITKIESRHTDTSEVQIGMSPKEVRRYSFGRAIAAALTGDWRDAKLERECSEAVAKIMGRAPEGFYVPPDVFRRDFNVGTGSEAGNLVPTQFRGDMFVDALRNNLVMGQLGATILSGLTGNVDLPRKSSVSTIGSATEIGSASETNPNTAKVTLSPKRATAYVEVSKQAIIQSAIALEAMIRDDLLMGAAVNVENQCINGTATSPQVTGIRFTTGIGTVAAGANGALPTWGNMVDLESACANANAEPDRLAGYLMNTRLRGRLKQVQMGTNLPFIWAAGAQPVNGYRALVSNNVPSNLTKGTSTTICSAALFGSDWSMATIGLFGAPDITVDPYTKADTGQVKITLNQFFDFGIRQPACFAKIEDLLTS